jgi:hypothetical protein
MVLGRIATGGNGRGGLRVCLVSREICSNDVMQMGGYYKAAHGECVT